jgi:uncharacterized membrane protein (DUF485 family)
MKDKFQLVLDSIAFKKLVIRKWTISILLTILMLSAYFGFILTVAIDKQFFSKMIADHITLAIPTGIGLIIFAWLMTGVYTYWANNYYDKEVEAIKKELE